MGAGVKTVASDDIASRLRAETLRLLAEAGDYVKWAAPVWAAVAVILFSGIFPALGTSRWWEGAIFLGANSAWALALAYELNRYRRDGGLMRGPDYWLARLRILLVISALLWTSILGLFWQDGNVANNIFIVVWMAGTAANNNAVFACCWRVLCAATTIICGATWARFASSSGELSLLISIVSPLFALSMLYHGRMAYLSIRNALETRLRNEMITRDLFRARDEAVRQRQQAQAASAAKSTFLANMSHELRTPLNAIIGFAEIIQSQYLGPIGEERYLEYARDIHGSGQHLLALINDILDISKIESGRLELEPRPIAPCAAIEDAMRLMRPRAAEKRQLLFGEAAPDCPAVFADPRAIKQILVNLLSNAVKFTPAGGKISISARPVGETIEFRVTDSGCGISPDHLERIFEPFYQADSRYNRNAEGTGLGLALVKGLVVLHGGTCEIESAPDTGTSVRIRLPRHAADEMPIAAA